MKTYSQFLAVSLTLSLASCSLFSPKDQPLDISKGMPRVSDVVTSIQAAIDKSGGHEGWKPSSPFETAKQQCADKRSTQEADLKRDCVAEHTVGMKECASYSGANSSVQCGDALRRAQARCDKLAGDDPKECAGLELLAPPHVVSATLEFTAVATKTRGGSVDFMLISGGVSGALGRRQSLEMVLVPAPVVKNQLAIENPVLFSRLARVATLKDKVEFLSRDSANEVQRMSALSAYKDTSDELERNFQLSEPQQAALIASLEPTPPPTHSDPAEGLYEALNEILSVAIVNNPASERQLTLKSAKYVFAIEYKVLKEGGFKWTITPAKLSGEAGAGKERLTGNIMEIEIAR
jgi:hypothetical protein